MTDERGFTLVEVLTVVVIIPILAGIAIPSFVSQQKSAKDPQAKSAARTAATTIELYRTEAKTYDGVSAATLQAMEPTLREVARGNLTVRGYGTAGYTVSVRHAETGNVFTISRTNGVTSRTCTVKANAGCPDSGVW